MSDVASAPVQPSTPPKAKPLLSKLDAFTCVVLLMLAAIAGFFWYRSYTSPYHSSWSKPQIRACGRVISENGRFVWQKCMVTTFQNSASNQSLTSPILAGSNPSGDRMTIPCGDADVTFTMPYPDRITGYQKVMSGFGNGTLNYRFEWTEGTFKYWVAVAAPLILVLLCLIQPAFQLFTGWRRARRQQQSVSVTRR